MSEVKNLGISLTGGGARGSYQAGVLRGVAEILKEQDLVGSNNPFQYWSGVSAGSINATLCSSGLDHFDEATDRLVELWQTIRPQDVYRTDLTSIGKNSARWIRDLTFGNVFKHKLARSLLDTEPLWGLLQKNINFKNIQKNIDSGILKGVACSAYNYSDHRTVTYLQTKEDISWDRPRRVSEKIDINVQHVIASCAIPMLFPAVQIKNNFYADGSFRNLSPISPVLHMGATKILVIGVRGINELSEKNSHANPSMAKIAGAILNALFFDTIDIDLERVRHINEMVEAVRGEIETKRSNYSKIDCFVVRPSVDIGLIAAEKAKSFPKVIEFLLGGLGTLEESSELASYILFVSSFTKDLVDIGYADAMKQKGELLKWLIH